MSKPAQAYFDDCQNHLLHAIKDTAKAKHYTLCSDIGALYAAIIADEDCILGKESDPEVRLKSTINVHTKLDDAMLTASSAIEDESLPLALIADLEEAIRSVYLVLAHSELPQ